MIDSPEPARDDLHNIFWRHHAKRNIPPSLVGKQVNDEDLAQLANACCLVIEEILEPPDQLSYSPQPLKASLIYQQRRRRYQKISEEQKRLVPILETVLAVLDGDEWYYFWGLHQILNTLSQIQEKI